MLQGDAETALERLSDVLEKDLPHFYSREEFWREKGTLRDEVCHPDTAFGTWPEGSYSSQPVLFHMSLLLSYILYKLMWRQCRRESVARCNLSHVACVTAVPGGGNNQ